MMTILRERILHCRRELNKKCCVILVCHHAVGHNLARVLAHVREEVLWKIQMDGRKGLAL